MAKDIEPHVTIADALQNVAEALGKLEQCLPPHERERYAKTVERLRRARVELSQWVSEQRG